MSALAEHIHLNAEVVAVGATISSYYSSNPQPNIPYWTLGFADTTIRLLGSDDFAPEVKADAARSLTDALVEGSLHVPVSHRLGLHDIARAHELVKRGAAPGRVILTLA